MLHASSPHPQPPLLPQAKSPHTRAESVKEANPELTDVGTGKHPLSSLVPRWYPGGPLQPPGRIRRESRVTDPEATLPAHGARRGQ